MPSAPLDWPTHLHELGGVLLEIATDPPGFTH